MRSRALHRIKTRGARFARLQFFGEAFDLQLQRAVFAYFDRQLLNATLQCPRGIDFCRQFSNPGLQGLGLFLFVFQSIARGFLLPRLLVALFFQFAQLCLEGLKFGLSGAQRFIGGRTLLFAFLQCELLLG